MCYTPYRKPQEVVICQAVQGSPPKELSGGAEGQAGLLGLPRGLHCGVGGEVVDSMVLCTLSSCYEFVCLGWGEVDVVHGQTRVVPPSAV